MAKYEIVYFPVRGKCETSRIMLIDNGIEFTDTFVTGEQWFQPNCQSKAEAPFGQLMLFKVDGKIFAQSGAIDRYIARHLVGKLHGVDPFEEMEIEMYYEQVNDVLAEMYNVCYKNWENGYQPFVESISKRLQPFEKKLQGNQYLINNRLTMADYKLYVGLFNLNTLKNGCLDDVPNCKAFFERFKSRPKIQAYDENPKYKGLKLTGSAHL